jgi:hypothetical protein
MKTQHMALLVLLAATLLLVVASATAATGASRDSPRLDYSWNVLGAGGGHAASASYSLEATLGQPLAGARSGPAVTIAAGFWQDLAGTRVYLPVVIK